MTVFLWSFEALARLCGHQDPGVKGWAADRARRLYPKEAGPLMVRLLSDRNESVVAQAAAYFCAYPDRNIADALLAAFRRSTGVSAERLAHALVLLKDGRLLDAVRGPVSLDDRLTAVNNIYIKKVEKKKMFGYDKEELWNTVIKTYPNVSQFWTYDRAAFLKQPVYSRDFPPCKFCD